MSQQQPDNDPGKSGQSLDDTGQQPHVEPISPNDTYDISVVGRETAGTHEVIAHTTEEGPVAGHKVRRLIEKKGYDPERPIYLGYDDAARGGFREAGYDFDVFKKHFWVSGTTGAGKTTVLHNKALHHAFGNHGFCNIDPKADGDTIDLLRKIPAVRLDDVIFIEPGSSQFDRTIGINILDVPAIEDRDEREKEIENRLENLTAIFDNDDYWGPTMASITESMGRAMLRHNAEVSLDPDRDASDKYSVIDMYFILLDQERRENFAETVDDPYLRDFLWQIADMKDEEVRPLLKRIKRWVENPIVRRIVAQRESTIDWDRIVDEGKILLVRIPVDSKDVHQMITLTVLRNLWSAKKRQVRDDDRPDDQPYFVQVDEFEKVANENLNMDGMLARARSFWLSVSLGTQYPGQIKTDHEPILRAMENNCNTLLAMKTPGSKDSKLLMQRFTDYDSTDLINTDQHRTWTKIPLPDGTESEPVNIKTFAPYPPLRDADAATAAIVHSLREYGTAPITESEIQNDLKVGNVGELTNPASAGFDELASSEDSSLSLSMVPDEKFLEAVFAAQIQYEGVSEPVPQTNVEEALAVRVGDVGFDSEIANRFEKNNQIIVADARVDGEVAVRLIEDGLNTVLSHDTGSSASGGGPDHRWVLRQSYKTFTKLGAITSLPTQEGDELPDGVADLPHDPMAEADTVKEANKIQNKMIDEHPTLWELANGRDIAIEAETSTIKKPKQTLTNLRKAIEADKTCVFACKDAHSDDVDGHDLKYWPHRGEQLIYRTEGGTIDYDTINCVSKVLSSGDRTFYNKTSYLKLDTANVVVAPRPDTHDELLWREDGEEIVAISKGGDREELARFGNAELAGDPPAATTMHREKQGDQWVVKTGTGSDAEIEATFDDLDALEAEYMDLYAPFIPENEFPRPVEDDDFTFMAFPDADNDEHAEPVIVEHGRATKLSELSASDTDDMEIDDDPLSVDGDEGADTPTDNQDQSSKCSYPGCESETSVQDAGSGASYCSKEHLFDHVNGEALSDPDHTVSATETPPSTATINPHELTGQHNDRFEIETLQTWASGAALPNNEQFQQFIDTVESINPEAAAYIEAPEDIPTVMGVGTAGSSQPTDQSTNSGSDTDTDSTDESGASNITLG